ncbi:recombinase family protein [Burkholderia sp. JSH-S8]|nr:recombinase family protein [Burkholderia sp. JSH-S8]
MRIGYARVSTEEQNLDLQLIALEAAGCDPVITDHGVSGARFDRPGLQEVLALAQSDDTIVVWRLDRLGRSLSHLVEMMNGFRARGIHFMSLNEAIDTGTSAGMFMFHMIAALAEFERALIGERTRAGVAAARSRGQRLGRPRALDRHQIEQARDLLRTQPEADVAARFNIQRRTLRRLVCGLAAYPTPVSATVETDRNEAKHERPERTTDT